MDTVDSELAMKVVPLAPDGVLRALATASAGTGVDQRPLVRLRIASGHVVEGRLIGVGTDRDEEVAMLGCSAGGTAQPLDEVVYLRMRDLVSTGVWHPERYRDVLSGGALALLPDGEPTSRLALRRRFAATPDVPLRLDWDALPDSPAVTANLAALLDGLWLAVDAVRVDDLGRRAWAEVSAVRVEHLAGARLLVRPTPAGPLVTADLTAALPRDLTGEMSRQLNAAL